MAAMVGRRRAMSAKKSKEAKKELLKRGHCEADMSSVNTVADKGASVWL